MRGEPAAGARLARFNAAIGDYRSLTAIVAGLALVQAGVAALSAFAPLTLLERGVNAAGVGAVAAGYAFGFLGGAFRAANAVRAIGHIRAFSGFAGLAALAALGLHAWDQLGAWFLLQAVLGFCVSSLLTAGESWIADVAPRERRGALLAFYLVVSKLGQIAGPVALAALAPGDPSGFMAIAALFAASLIPVSVTRRAQPAPPSSEPFGVRDLWRTAPAAVIAALTAGAVNGAVLQLYALYATAHPFAGGMAAAAALNGVIALGSVLAQWPAGWASDRTDRRVVIAALAIAGCISSIGLGFGGLLPWPVILLLAGVWGAGSMSFYGVAVAHAADRAAPGQATAMMAGILVVWAIGAIAGPVIAGVIMSTPIGAGGLFFYAAAVLAGLAIAMLTRSVGSAAPQSDEKSPFTAAPATSPALAHLDPRADDDPQLDLFAESAYSNGDQA